MHTQTNKPARFETFDMERAAGVGAVPICVDLDGTLIRSDLLVESFLALLRKNFLLVALVPFWLLRGRAALKREIASRVQLDAEALPYAERFVESLRQRRSAGARLVLCTASDERLAAAVSSHLGIFDEVLASDGSINLKGTNKRDMLTRRYGEQGFDYAGNDAADLLVWAHARRAMVVNAADSVTTKARALGNVAEVFDRRSSSLKTWARALRLHQWLKNFLVFVPLLGAHKLGDWSTVANAAIAFLAFGLCASSVYLLNDLLDLPSDRRHPKKRLRPFAAGSLPLAAGLAMMPLLLVAAIALSVAFLPWQFLVVLAVYYVLTLAYSVWLKPKPIVDVLVLAGLYTTRIIAGGAAVQVSLSFWLLALSMFLFLSLAMVKRYAELLTMSKEGKSHAQGRGYTVADLPVLQSLGTAAGYMSVLVMALYVNSPESRALYRHPEVIWLLGLVLLFWISRVWLKTHRDEMHDDPVVWAIKDRVSLVLAVLGVAIVWAAL